MARLAKFVLIFVAGLACLLLAGYFILGSPAFQRYVLAKIEQKARESTGARVEIRNFAFHVSTLTADLEGIVVHGTEASTGRPLLAADRLTVDLQVVSLLRRKLDLREIILRHPVVNLTVAKNGSTNLPHPPRSNRGSTNVFDLGIQHLLLTKGEVYYNDVKTPLDAELHGLSLEVKSRINSSHYDGFLSYRDGWLQFGRLKPLPHALRATFSATPSEVELRQLVLMLGGSTLELEANVRDFSNPEIAGKYQLLVHAQNFRALLRNPNIPAGEVRVSGSLRYHYTPETPMVRTLQLDGRLESPALRVNSPEVRTVVRNVRGEFHFADGILNVPRVHAEALGGRLNAIVTMRNLESNPVARLQATLEAISLDAAKAGWNNGSIRRLPLTGQLSGTALVSWTGALANLEAQSRWYLNGALVSPAGGGRNVPLTGEAHVNYARERNRVTLAHTFLQTPQNRIDLNGLASPTMNLRIRAHASELGELQSLVAALDTSAARGTARAAPVPVRLGGAADGQFLVRGSTSDPSISGSVAGRNLKLANTEWRSLQAQVQARKSGLEIQRGSLVNARQGYVNFDLKVALSNWHYLPSNPVRAQLMSRGLAIAPILRLTGHTYPVSGNLSVDLSLRGSQLSPVGQGSVRLLQARIYGQPMQDLSVRFRGTGDVVRSSLRAQMPAGTATAELLFYPGNKAYDLQLNAPHVALDQLQPVVRRNLALRGVLSLKASGRGTLENPQFAAALQVPQLELRETTLSGISAHLTVANHVANVTLDSQVAQSFVRSRATINLSGDYHTRATLDTAVIPLEGLLALAGPTQMGGIQGQVELHASAQGPLKDLNSLQAQAVIPTLQARYEQLSLANRQPIRIRYADSVVTIEPTEFAGTGTDIRIQGRLPLNGSVPPSLTAVGAVDAQLLRFLQPEAKGSGKLALDVRASRIAGKPSVQGQLRVQDVSFLTPDLPVGLEHLNGVIDIRNNQATITKLTGQAGGGRVSASGTIAFQPGLPMNVAMRADNVRIRYQDAIRIVASSDLTLQGTSAASTLKGLVTVNSLGFTRPDLDLAQLASQFQTTGYEKPPTQEFASKLKLNINVRSSQQLNLASTQVDLRGSLNLHIIGTAAEPVITGRSEFRGGDLFLMGKRYRIERGIIEFPNATQTQPVLNVQVTTTINQYNLRLSFTGPLDRLRTSYVSDPPLPTADIINLIARGQTTEQAQAAPFNIGASSLLAEGVASQLSTGIQRLAGFSSFSIDPTLGGNDRNPGARIGFQRRVTKNLFLTFATDVTSAQREIIQGEYQFNRRWSMTVTRDENGGFAIDGKFHKKF
jgi:translocation and assembly module TamB